jgi:hypothetical protein
MTLLLRKQRAQAHKRWEPLQLARRRPQFPRAHALVGSQCGALSSPPLLCFRLRPTRALCAVGRCLPRAQALLILRKTGGFDVRQKYYRCPHCRFPRARLGARRRVGDDRQYRRRQQHGKNNGNNGFGPRNRNGRTASIRTNHRWLWASCVGGARFPAHILVAIQERSQEGPEGRSVGLVAFRVRDGPRRRRDGFVLSFGGALTLPSSRPRAGSRLH